ncbi:hypothetical protein Gohar_027391, partial [Gossypium harknessii]|nr:hypothetical protein [Gossypium harknessii]
MQRVIGDSLLVVRKIENVATGPNNRPKLPCIIAECGEIVWASGVFTLIIGVLSSFPPTLSLSPPDSRVTERVEFELRLPKMAFSLRSVKVPPNSASLEEARSRVFDFFRKACRSIPTIMDIYNLDDVVTKSELRSSISSEIRKNSHVTNPKVRSPISPILGRSYRIPLFGYVLEDGIGHGCLKKNELMDSMCAIGKFSACCIPQVIDLLLFKGMEELNNIVEHAKQRHHIIGQYVLGRQGLAQELKQKLLLMNMIDGVGVVLGLCSGSIVASPCDMKGPGKRVKLLGEDQAQTDYKFVLADWNLS